MSKGKNKGKGPRKPQDGPKLNDQALEQLTAKIDQNLNGKEKELKRKQPPTNVSTKQDQKRQRNSVNGQDKQQKSPAKGSGKGLGQAAIMAEIKELGGDEKDWDLIKDIDSSDDELVNGDKKTIDKGLKDELAALSKQLGFANYQPSEASEEEDQEEVDEEDGVEEEEEELDDSEEEDEGPEPPKVQKKPGDMKLDPRADWHASEVSKLPNPKGDQPISFTPAVEALKAHAQTLLEEDATKYRNSVFAQSSHKFLATIMSSGTLNDKVSALTLAIQESPVHNIRAFDALLNLASKKSRAQAIGAIGALVDSLGPGTILPPDRRLRTFQNQPGLLGTLQKTSTKSWRPGQPLPGRISEAHLILWIYEDWLKATYFKIIQLLESWCSDEIEYSRSRSLDFIYGLLKEKPEQEANLLKLLVNKLGDRDRKIASRASYLLLQLQSSHPGMKPIIIRTIEQDILLHPSQDHRVKYYAINTLNQTILSNKEPLVAEALVRMYFDLFVTLLKAGSLGMGPQAEKFGPQDEQDNKQGKPGRPKRKRGPPSQPSTPKPTEQDVETADKLVSAILTGVNRAAPFVDNNNGIMEKHLDTLFRIAHSANFNTGIQALLLIQHISTSRNIGSDRFYRTLYESLLDPRLVTSSKQSLYLNLLLRALKNDVDVRRVKAFAKRMLQITALHQPAFVCGLLYVVAHLGGTFPDLKTLLQDPEESPFDGDESDQRPKYDGRKRDPEHSNADRSCLWEMVPVLSHYHPSVTVLASALLEGQTKLAKPDLDSHSLIRFLDKFAYRKPKASDTARGASIMQPLKASKDLGDIWLSSRATGAAGPAINTEAFYNKKAEDVAAEDVFFHKYFQTAAREGKATKSKVSSGGDDGDEEDGEDEIWKALVNAQPDIDDDGSDVGFDLDEDEMASDDDDEDQPDLEDDEDDEDDDDNASHDGISDLEDSDDEVDIEDGALDELVQIEEDEDGFDIKDAAEDKKEAKDKRKSRKKALKDLPTFASVDDYAELLGQDDDEDY